MNWFHRLTTRHKPRISTELWQRCVQRLPFLHRLAPADMRRLKTLSEALLREKTITGVEGLEITDEMAVMITAQASLLILNLDIRLYDDMTGVVVYPSAFIVPHKTFDEAGVMHEWREPLSGEAIDGGGAVVLSWPDVEQPSFPGQNLVIHEFAHKIDMGRGGANGCPPFLAGHHENMKVSDWQRAFSTAFTDFVRMVDTIDARNAHDPDSDDAYDALPLDPYAAYAPAEFFAVASETFFVLPAPLAAGYPEVYRLLAQYYRQDPLSASAMQDNNAG